MGRLAHRPADHPDQGERHLGLHSDQLISITDGQCFLETTCSTRVCARDQRRRVGVAVGGAAQIKAMKEVAESLRLDLSQYRELESFAMFSSDLDETTKAQLERGERYGTAQTAAEPSVAVEQQVVSILLGTKGHRIRCLPGMCAGSKPSSSTMSVGPMRTSSTRSESPRDSSTTSPRS